MKRIFALFFAVTLMAAVPALAQKQYKVAIPSSLVAKAVGTISITTRMVNACSLRVEAT